MSCTGPSRSYGGWSLAGSPTYSAWPPRDTNRYFGRSSHATWQPFHVGCTPGSQISSTGDKHSASGMDCDPSAWGTQMMRRHAQITTTLRAIERTETTSKNTTALASSQAGQGHGARRVQLAKGALYVGAVDARGRPHGEGELLLRDGSVHAGHFVEGAAHGEGAPARTAAACAPRPHRSTCTRHLQLAPPQTGRPRTPGVYFDRDGSVHCGSWVTNFRVGDFGESARE